MAIKHKRNTQLRSARHRRHRRHAHASGADAAAADYDDDDATTDYVDAQITPAMFVEMCPLMLLQLDQRACAGDAVRAEPVRPAAHSANETFYGEANNSRCSPHLSCT